MIRTSSILVSAALCVASPAAAQDQREAPEDLVAQFITRRVTTAPILALSGCPEDSEWQREVVDAFASIEPSADQLLILASLWSTADKDCNRRWVIPWFERQLSTDLRQRMASSLAELYLRLVPPNEDSRLVALALDPERNAETRVAFLNAVHYKLRPERQVRFFASLLASAEDVPDRYFNDARTWLLGNPASRDYFAVASVRAALASPKTVQSVLTVGQVTNFLGAPGSPSHLAEEARANVLDLLEEALARGGLDDEVHAVVERVLREQRQPPSTGPSFLQVVLPHSPPMRLP